MTLGARVSDSNNLLELQGAFYNHLKQKGRSINTLKNYKTDLQCFNTFLQQEKQKLDIFKMDIPHVEEYGAYLQRKYNSDNSRRRRVQALRLFFDFLLEKNMVRSNPVRQIPTSPKFLDDPHPTSMVDLKTLWHFLLEENCSSNSISRLLAKRNKVIVLLIYSGGLKVSDLSSLKVGQILLPSKEDEPAKVLINPTKRDPYTVPLCQAFTPVYQDYINDLNLQKSKQNITFNQVLFNANPYSILSGGLSSRGIEVIFEEWRNKLMVEITAKTLRQSCIYLWLQRRNPDSLIKEWMGVAPSYSLKLYKKDKNKHVFDDTFLLELFYHHKDHNNTKTC